MRWHALLVLAGGSVLILADRSWSQTAPASPPATSTNVEEWRATDLSLLDFVTDGYDLVSVISPSSHTRLYFLTKPGRIVKCRGGNSDRPSPYSSAAANARAGRNICTDAAGSGTGGNIHATDPGASRGIRAASGQCYRQRSH
jgi:hypothetical protein